MEGNRKGVSFMYIAIRAPYDLQDHGVFLKPKGEFPIVNQLRILLKDRNITYLDFSKAVGISRQSLDGFLNNSFVPKIETVLKMATVLSVPVEDIYQLTDSAWVETAKDENNHTLYFDHLDSAIRSGSDMKGLDRSVYIRQEGLERLLVPRSGFIKGLQQAGDAAAKEAKKRNPSLNRDELADIKAQARETYEANHQLRFSTLYRELPMVVIRD